MQFFTTLPLFYYQQYIIFLLQKYLFCLFFNVENKVELMRSEWTSLCSSELRHSKHHSAVIGQRVPVWANKMPGAALHSFYSAHCCRGEDGVGEGRGAGAEIGLIITEKWYHWHMQKNLRSPKKQTSATEKWELICLKQNISLTYKLKQINIVIMIIFLTLYNIIGIKK